MVLPFLLVRYPYIHMCRGSVDLKKVIFVFVAALLGMVGCSSEDTSAPQKEYINSELERFIDEYNNQVEESNNSNIDFPEIEKIQKKNVGKIKKENGKYWRKLLRIEQEEVWEYEILALYNSDKELTGYSVSSINQKAVVAGLLVAESLGLDAKVYSDELEKIVNGGAGKRSYYDSGYEIHFAIKPDIGSYTVSFDKVE